MNRIYIFFAAICTTLLCISCEKEGHYTQLPKDNFEALWQIMDEQYCFFEYKDVDWNEVHDRYALQMSDTLNQYELFDLLGTMLGELKDGHTNLFSSFDVSRYWKWYEDYPDNYMERLVIGSQAKYLGTDYKMAGGVKYKAFPKGMIAGQTDSIGYFHYESFASGVGDTNLDYMLYAFRDCKGLIIDIRNNGGGSLVNSDRIASRFVEQKMLCGYVKHKTGPGHQQFSEPFPVYLEPTPDRIMWFRPVVVLTNRRCYSAANDFVTKMKLLPNVTIMGDRTGGGSGFPFYSELPNGWGVRFSTSPMLDADMKDTEYGIDPDIKVDLDLNAAANGDDSMINAAINHLLKEKSKNK